MSLRAYQTSKHWSAVSNMMRDFTTMESYHSGNHFIYVYVDDREKKQRYCFTYNVIYKYWMSTCVLLHRVVALDEKVNFFSPLTTLPV